MSVLVSPSDGCLQADRAQALRDPRCSLDLLTYARMCTRVQYALSVPTRAIKCIHTRHKITTAARMSLHVLRTPMNHNATTPAFVDRGLFTPESILSTPRNWRGYGQCYNSATKVLQT